jgi:elongation factor G
LKTYPMDKIRNVALVAPHGAGKTSLADAMLHVTEKVGRRGSIDDGSSVFDYLEEEIEKKQTISASLAWTEFEGNKVNIIDTPGVDDFRGDVYASLRVVEGVIFVVKADGGFEVASENLWNFVRKTEMPTFLVVNRMSKEQANWRETMNGIKDRVAGAAPLQLPIGSGDDFSGVIDLIDMKAYKFDGNKAVEMDIPGDMADAVEEAREMLIDAAANADDELTEKYLEELTLENDDIILGLKKGTAEGTVYPVFFTDAVREIGVTSLMRSITSLFPSANSRTKSEMAGVVPGTEDEATFTPSADGPAVAFAFKRQYEAQGGDVTWLRVFSGSIKSGDTLKCSDGRSSERVGQLNVTMGKAKEKIDVAGPGDIVLAAKLKSTQTGTTLASGVEFAFAPIYYPVPTSADAISPTTSG